MDIQKKTQTLKTIFNRKFSFATTAEIASNPTNSDTISPVTVTTLKEEGKNEQIISEAAKKEEDKQTVNDLIKKSNRCIISIHSHFPWTFFPNTIQVEEGRVTLTFRQFLASQTHSVDIKDISNVLIESSPFLATLKIVSRTYRQNEIAISHLRTKEAYRVQMIIEGLRTFAQHTIDTSIYDIPNLIAKIEEFQSNAHT